jgi:hypothetical protein
VKKITLRATFFNERNLPKFAGKNVSPTTSLRTEVAPLDPCSKKEGVEYPTPSFFEM